MKTNFSPAQLGLSPVNGRAVQNSNLNNFKTMPPQAGVMTAQSIMGTGKSTFNPNSLIRTLPLAAQGIGMPAPNNIMIPQKGHEFDSLQEVAGVNIYPLPPNVTVQVAATALGGSAAIRVFILNQFGTPFNNITNNGGGAGTVTYAYSDGFSGSVTDKVLGNARQGMGAICYGVAMRMVVTATKAGDPTSLNASNPRFDIYNPYGSTIPTNFNVTSDQTRGDFDNSVEVMPCLQNIPAFCQFSFIQPTGGTTTVVFNLTNNFRR